MVQERNAVVTTHTTVPINHNHPVIIHQMAPLVQESKHYHPAQTIDNIKTHFIILTVL